MSGTNHRGFYMAPHILRKMSADAAVNMAVTSARTWGVTRKKIERDMDLGRGQVSRWASGADHHVPNMEHLQELVGLTSPPRVGNYEQDKQAIYSNPIIQWIVEGALDCGLEYEKMQPIEASALVDEQMSLARHCCNATLSILDALTDHEITRTERMRMVKALDELSGKCLELRVKVQSSPGLPGKDEREAYI